VESYVGVDGKGIAGVERGVELVFGRDVRSGRRRVREQHDHDVPRDVELATARSVHDVVVPPHTVTVNAQHDRLCEVLGMLHRETNFVSFVS
jgi:hypothetical protein